MGGLVGSCRCPDAACGLRPQPMMDAFGAVDILVLNSCGPAQSAAAEISSSEMQDSLDLILHPPSGSSGGRWDRALARMGRVGGRGLRGARRGP